MSFGFAVKYNQNCFFRSSALPLDVAEFFVSSTSECNGVETLLEKLQLTFSKKTTYHNQLSHLVVMVVFTAIFVIKQVWKNSFKILLELYLWHVCFNKSRIWTEWALYISAFFIMTIVNRYTHFAGFRL